MRANDSTETTISDKVAFIILHIIHQVVRVPYVRFMDIPLSSLVVLTLLQVLTAKQCEKKRGADQIYNDAMWLFIVSSSPTCAVWLKQAARCT